MTPSSERASAGGDAAARAGGPGPAVQGQGAAAWVHHWNASDHFDERCPGSKALQDLGKKRSQPGPVHGVRGIARSQPDDRCRRIDERGERGKILILRHDDVSVLAGKLEDGAIIESQAGLIADVDRFVCMLAEPGGEAWRQVGIYEKLHPDCAGTILWFRYAALHLVNPL